MAKSRKKPTKKTFRPGKDLVTSVAQNLMPKLIRSMESGIKNVTINFSGVNALDSMGLGLIIAAHNSLENAGGSLTITNASEDIGRLLTTLRLDKHFEVQVN